MDEHVAVLSATAAEQAEAEPLAIHAARYR